VREPIDDQEALEVEAVAPVQHPVVAAMASNYQMEPSSSQQLSRAFSRFALDARLPCLAEKLTADRNNVARLKVRRRGG
jgi:hypothetical protein